MTNLNPLEQAQVEQAAFAKGGGKVTVAVVPNAGCALRLDTQLTWPSLLNSGF
jgi:hypothetical protein